MILHTGNNLTFYLFVISVGLSRECISLFVVFLCFRHILMLSHNVVFLHLSFTLSSPLRNKG